MNFTGILFSLTIPNTTPPFAVPSNFVNTTPSISIINGNNKMISKMLESFRVDEKDKERQNNL